MGNSHAGASGGTLQSQLQLALPHPSLPPPLPLSCCPLSTTTVVIITIAAALTLFGGVIIVSPPAPTTRVTAITNLPLLLLLLTTTIIITIIIIIIIIVATVAVKRPIIRFAQKVAVHGRKLHALAVNLGHTDLGLVVRGR